MAKSEYILATYSRGTNTVKRFDLDDYPDSALEKLRLIDFKQSDEDDKGVVGWALYKYDGDIYNIIDKDTLDYSVFQEIEDYIYSSVNRLFKDDTDEYKVNDLYNKWEEFANSTEGEQQIVNYAFQALLQAHNRKEYLASVSDLGEIKFDDSSLIKGTVYDISKLKDNSELHALVSLHIKADLVAENKDVVISAAILIFHFVYDGNTIIQDIYDPGNWAADLHNIEIEVI